MTKSEIEAIVLKMAEETERLSSAVTDFVDINEYHSFVREEEHDGEILHIWTDAFNKALCEHKGLIVPEGVYCVDETIVMHSGNKIKAHENAVIRKKEGVKVLLLRNENIIDESYGLAPKDSKKDENIFIEGGIWEECYTKRTEYGFYDEKNSMSGITACMHFSNVKNFSLKNAVFKKSGHFSFQCGNIENACFENIRFVDCNADGLHINGNTKNVLIRNVKGNVGDDIVALNMFDWDYCSINFGPMDTVLCENVELSEESKYKAIRIFPAYYKFKDETEIDCSASNMILRNIRGVETVKMYLQTFWYPIDKPIIGKPGSGHSIYFEDIEINLTKPVDNFANYINSDSETGHFAAFEIGANIRDVSFENITFKLPREKYPLSYFLLVGPKSSYINFDGGMNEIFAPYMNCEVENVTFENVETNGENVKDMSDYIKVNKFFGLHGTDYMNGQGKIGKIIYK